MSVHWIDETADTNPQILRGAGAEAIATFIFVFVGCSGATVLTHIAPIAFTFGLAIMVMAFAIGDVSGGHINPAVSLAMAITGNCSMYKAAVYTVAQLIGSIFAALFLRTLLPAALLKAGAVHLNLGANGMNPGMTVGQGILMEIVSTFTLVFTIFATCKPNGKDADKRTPYAAIPIGFAVVLGILATGHLSGGSMNPARSFGPALASNEWKNHIVYWVGPLVGASVAGLLYKFLFQDKDESTSDEESAPINPKK